MLKRPPVAPRPRVWGYNLNNLYCRKFADKSLVNWGFFHHISFISSLTGRHLTRTDMILMKKIMKKSL